MHTSLILKGQHVRGRPSSLQHTGTTSAPTGDCWTANRHSSNRIKVLASLHTSPFHPRAGPVKPTLRPQIISAARAAVLRVPSGSRWDLHSPLHHTLTMAELILFQPWRLRTRPRQPRDSRYPSDTSVAASSVGVQEPRHPTGIGSPPTGDSLSPTGVSTQRGASRLSGTVYKSRLLAASIRPWAL